MLIIIIIIIYYYFYFKQEYDIQSLVRKHGSVVGLATSAAIGGSVKVFESCMYRGKGQLIITSDVGKIL